MKSLDTAIAHAGGVSKLASSIGVKPSVIGNWRKRETVIDAKHCVAIERATLGRITRRDLRPDDWHLIWPELATTAAHDGEASHD